MNKLQIRDELGSRVQLRTRWVDEDNQGVLNNAVYLTLMEEARFAYFSKLGQLSDNQFPFVLAQVETRFVAPGRGGADVMVELATTHLGRSSFQQEYRIRDADSGDVWCEARALLVLWDNESRAKMEMPSAFREAIAGLEGLPR